MQAGNLRYKVEITQAKLQSIVDEVLDQAITPEPLEVNGVEAVLKKVGKADVDLNGKKVMLGLPIEVNLKRQAGLFSVEGNGTIKLSISVDYDINKNLRLKCKSDLYGHEWLTKPKLEVGALNIPVETLMNLILKHQESIITARIDEAINSRGDLSPLVFQSLQKLEAKVSETLPGKNALDLGVKALRIVPPVKLDDLFQIAGDLLIDVNLSDGSRGKNDLLPEINWLESTQASQPLVLGAQVKYDDLAQLAVAQLKDIQIGGRKISITDIDVTSTDGLLTVEADLVDPIKGSARVKARPIYNELEQKVYIEDVDVKVKPSNLIYKMTAPIVNNVIEDEIEKRFPMDVKAIIGKGMEKLPGSFVIPEGVIKPKLSNIVVQRLDFGSEYIEVIVHVKDTELNVEIA